MTFLSAIIFHIILVPKRIKAIFSIYTILLNQLLCVLSKATPLAVTTERREIQNQESGI